ncbi:LOW QUALITY PROTEIN: tRNA (uracil-5-)-methyltransferase homolog B [Pteropus medius]|uniref:LOW QUALITY PROTEIN: tRNA (uracil(54)-C(5))-methyltransferase homolog n=1 Tax=Pteropus vampyrus TaxID=132908 RepID=UPI00196B99FA|nr:LOW QUALITY PROTEIN: tRNA (uracil(54)-C(5))-methyltransferase homolog [Pteropus giganteus]
MAIITFHPRELRQGRSRRESLSEMSLLDSRFCGLGKRNSVQETVKEFFTKGPGAFCDLTSLYFQESTMTCCSHQQSLYQLLFGEPHIFEDLLHQQSPYISLKIYISLDAFFQVNTAGTEMLYQTMGDLSRVNSNSILFDICCETGKWPPRAQSVCCLAPKPCPPSTHGPCSQCWKMMVVV